MATRCLLCHDHNISWVFLPHISWRLFPWQHFVCEFSLLVVVAFYGSLCFFELDVLFHVWSGRHWVHHGIFLKNIEHGKLSRIWYWVQHDNLLNISRFPIRFAETFVYLKRLSRTWHLIKHVLYFIFTANLRTKRTITWQFKNKMHFVFGFDHGKKLYSPWHLYCRHHGKMSLPRIFHCR